MGTTSSSSSDGQIGDRVYKPQTEEHFINTSQVGNVYVYGKTFVGPLCHHCIVVSGIDDKWRLYEWSKNDGTNGHKDLKMYAIERIKGVKNCYLGQHKLSDIYQAALKSSGKEYSLFSYNCNHWAEEVARNLGYNISVGCLIN